MAKHPGFEKVKKALEKTNGLISPAAKNLNIDRSTLYEWIKADKNLQKVVDDCREAFIDFCESKLAQNVNAGDVASIIFALKTVGKRRGFVERTEIDTTGGVEIKVTRE